MNCCYSLIILFLVLLSFTRCQRESFQPSEIDQSYITFGKGGGMTNKVDTYYLLRNGRLYLHNSLTQEYTKLPRLKKSDRTQIFTRAQQLPTTAFGCQEPGNIYYFLTVHTDTVRQCTWGRQDFTPSEELTSLYEYLRNATTNPL